MIITPTVGRIVWFYDEEHLPEEQPLAAIVCFVHSDRLVNLAVFGAEGAMEPAEEIVLVQEGDATPAGEAYAMWMPYQLGQAKLKQTKDA